MKKIRKAIAKKFKNWKGTTTADMENSDTPADVEEVKIEIKKQTNTVDKATETDTQLYEDINKSSETEQPIFENSEEVQNDSTAVEPTSVDRETNEQEPNPAEIELCFTTDEKDKPPTKTTQQSLAGVVGAVLLVNCVALYIMKMPIVAAVVGIVGLACISFALYHALKPNTKLEKMEDIEQLDPQNLKTSGMLERSQVSSNFSNKIISLEKLLSY
ncbi:hypothetical protein [Wolbachia endosymbiont of Oedothorax gibbosus]|uniref:hypothetical protein n=1 Tax=Wolbachia endosymbiont of Oedothorax gibbosus TaxID=931100 RepID=UPI002025B27E|nr:hypothetical protein [Wolbachia endosymbiont of Oedothorax gibbosus]